MCLVTGGSVTLPARLSRIPPLLLLLPAPPPAGQMQARVVSSPSHTRGWSTQPVPMQEDSPSHGAPPGWTTGGGTRRNIGETVVTPVRWSHSGDKGGSKLLKIYWIFDIINFVLVIEKI